MNRAVVGQASRLPSRRLVPGFVAGETPAKTAGTAAPLLPRARSWSQCAHTNGVGAFHEPSNQTWSRVRPSLVGRKPRAPAFSNTHLMGCPRTARNPAGLKFFLANPADRSNKEVLFETDGRWSSVIAVQCWEPRGNRGRLRHCNGLQTPTATGHEPGRRERGWRPQVRIPVWLCSSWPLVGAVNFSVTEKDEAISRTVFGKESLNAFILHPGGV